MYLHDVIIIMNLNQTLSCANVSFQLGEGNDCACYFQAAFKGSFLFYSHTVGNIDLFKLIAPHWLNLGVGIHACLVMMALGWNGSRHAVILPVMIAGLNP